MGLGVGIYWPATEAAVADLTTNEQRNEAFAITRLADSLGLGIGVILAGALIANSGRYRDLFLIDSVSFVVFFVIIYFAVPETYKFQKESRKFHQGWGVAFRDRSLMVFVLVNILFTTYLAQIQSTIPLYFTNFISSAGIDKGFSSTTISAIFTWHIVFAVLCQLPMARFINKFKRPRGLMLSLLLWGGGFLLIWVTGVVSNNALIWAVLGLGLLSLGMVSYTPSASALAVELAPESLRGVYLSINSQCWAIGYFIGPTLGGWILDQSSGIVYGFWLISAASVGVGILILQYLDRILGK
jgi:MFS family permease